MKPDNYYQSCCISTVLCVQQLHAHSHGQFTSEVVLVKVI